MQPNGGGTGGTALGGSAAMTGGSATGGSATGGAGAAGALGTAGAAGLGGASGSGGMNAATGGVAGSGGGQNPTKYPGPVVVPIGPQTCVASPQTLAEAGVCAGVRVGTALSRGIAAPYPEIFKREFNAFTPENDTKILERGECQLVECQRTRVQREHCIGSLVTRSS